MLTFCPQGKGNPNKLLLVCGENPHGSKAVHYKLHRVYIMGHICDKVFRHTLLIGTTPISPAGIQPFVSL